MLPFFFLPPIGLLRISCLMLWGCFEMKQTNRESEGSVCLADRAGVKVKELMWKEQEMF